MFTWSDKYAHKEKIRKHHSFKFKPLEPILAEKINPICQEIAENNPQLALDMFKKGDEPT